MSDLSQALVAQLAERAMQYGTPAAIPLVQRSAYLADALQRIRESGGQNIRTPLALGSNLLAEALDGINLKRANAALVAQTQKDQAGYMAAAMAGLGGAQGAPPQGPAPAATPPQGAAPPASFAPQAAAPPKFSPADEDAAIRMAWGEARGEGSGGQRAALGVAMNRAAMTGLPLSQIIAQPHQFAGYSPAAMALDPNSPAYQSIRANVEPLLLGQAPNPAFNAAGVPADHFYAPAGMPNGAKPSWDDGTGQMIGHQDFLSLGFGGKPPMSAPAGPFAPPQAMSPPAAAPTSPGGPQIGGGAAPMPQGAPLANPAPPLPGAATSPAAGGMPGAGVSSPAGGIAATPAELALIQQYMSSPYPDLRQRGAEMAWQIKQRMATPQAPPGPEYQWDPQRGQWAPKPGTTYSAANAGPGGFTQFSPFGQASAVANPNAGTIPAGSVASYGPNGPQVTRMGGAGERQATPQEIAQAGLPPGASATVDQATGKLTVLNAGADLKTLQASRDSWRNSDETKKANEAISAYNGLVGSIQGAAARNNGVLDTAAVDSFLRGINPGMGARNATVQMFLGHLGLPQELEGHLSSMFGNGYLTPDTLNQMLPVIRAYAEAHGQVAGQMAQNDLRAMPSGVSPDQLGETLPALMGPPRVQWLTGAPQPQGAAPGAPPNDPTSEELQRRGYRWNGQGWVK